MADPIRVVSSRKGHRYDAALYAPMEGRVCRLGLPDSFPECEPKLREPFAGAELFHLHWPELLLGPDPEAHARLIGLLDELGIPILWTQHNLLPHVWHPEWPGIYQLWADAARGVIHHSHWGMERVLEFRRYRSDALHRVIRHGHWGELRTSVDTLDREQLAKPYKMSPDRIHLGILGAPRPGKDHGLVVEGFLGSERDDFDLTIFSLAAGETVPEHPRILGRAYKRVSRSVYNRRLAFLDILIFPIQPDAELLTTGVAADAMAVAKPVITSTWPYLGEIFGEAALVFGSSADDLSACLAELDVATLDERAMAVRALQDAFSWERSAEQTLRLMEDLLALG